MDIELRVPENLNKEELSGHKNYWTDELGQQTLFRFLNKVPINYWTDELGGYENSYKTREIIQIDKINIHVQITAGSAKRHYSLFLSKLQ